METEENNNVRSNYFQDLKSAINFLTSSKGIRPQKVDKIKLKDAVDFIFKISVANGLPSEIIKNICVTFVFDNAFDIPRSRKLLYSCVPKSADFPYPVVPLAISSAALPNVSSTWQQSILNWLSGLLEYRIIEESNRYVHICYPSLFNLLDNIRLCGLICKILYQITRLEDVTSYRTKILLKLERKTGFSTCVSRLIRIYKFFRPDLIVSRLDLVGRFPSVPKWFQETLENAKVRLDNSHVISYDNQDLWSTFALKKRKLNPFHEAEVVPQPEILFYAENIEEQKEKRISVLQYKRINDMIKDLPHWKDWRWPNSAPCLLRKPVMIPLFKPHDPYVRVAITNWLELALRTEIVEQLGNPSMSRQENLLDACILLVKQSESVVPAVFHFLVEFLTKWDNFSHMTRMLDLLAFFPFISPTNFFESVFEKVSHILTTASLPLYCAFINALARMITTWALQAQNERTFYRNASDWPYDIRDTSPLEGIYYLTQRLERVFLGGIVRFGPHSLLINTCITYYNKVTLCCEELSLPLFVTPPVELLFAILTSGEVVASHRFGLLLSRLPERVKFVKRYEGTSDEKLMCSVVLSTVDRINFSLMSYLDITVSSLGFAERWEENLACYVGDSFYKDLTSMRNVQFFGAVCRSLPYLSLSCEYQQSKDFLKNKEQRHAAINEILIKLKNMNLDGLNKCARTYITN